MHGPDATLLQLQILLQNKNAGYKNSRSTECETRTGSGDSPVVEEGGFEPPKRKATDLQSAPFGHSGTLPY